LFHHPLGQSLMTKRALPVRFPLCHHHVSSLKQNGNVLVSFVFCLP
jgi:hypothetical protein